MKVDVDFMKCLWQILSQPLKEGKTHTHTHKMYNWQERRQKELFKMLNLNYKRKKRYGRQKQEWEHDQKIENSDKYGRC